MRLIFKDKRLRKSSKIRKWQRGVEETLNYRCINCQKKLNRILEDIMISNYRCPEVEIMDSDGFIVDPASLHTGDLVFKDRDVKHG